MDRREDLQALLEMISCCDVYFQPPESLKLTYPCIVYKRSSANTKFADDHPYNHRQRYQLIVIDPDPDSEIVGKIAKLPLCSYDRHYTKDNLNHDVYLIYF